MSEKPCDLPVMFRYTWPGEDEKHACFAHAAQVVNMAAAMGFRLQVHRLEIEEVLKNPQCAHTLRGTKTEPES